jgi:hypothetical protein
MAGWLVSNERIGLKGKSIFYEFELVVILSLQWSVPTSVSNWTSQW